MSYVPIYFVNYTASQVIITENKSLLRQLKSLAYLKTSLKSYNCGNESNQPSLSRWRSLR